jgi:hypothetical protein
MTQIMFPLDKAHEALDEFLGGGTDGERLTERWIAGKDGKPLAYFVPAGYLHDLRNGYHQWTEAQEVHDDHDLPPGYRPWLHSPLALEERLLPHEPLHEPLARMMFEKGYGELEEKSQWHVRATAIMCLLRVTLDPDGHGAVPVLMAGHETDEPGEALRWQLAFVTKVPGLYTRVTANGFFGEEWGIVTGSGFRVHTGWYSQEDATACAEALGRVLPNTDWMRLTPSGFTPKAMEAVRAVVRKYHRAGADDQAPEPAVMDDHLPAEDGPADVAQDTGQAQGAVP